MGPAPGGEACDGTLQYFAGVRALKEALPDERKGPLTCGGAKGTRTPNPLLAK